MKMNIKTKEQVQSEIGFGDVYTIEEFFDCVKCGSFIPYDGVGYFHDGDKETARSVWSEDISLLELKNYPYVCWYNR